MPLSGTSAVEAVALTPFPLVAYKRASSAAAYVALLVQRVARRAALSAFGALSVVGYQWSSGHRYAKNRHRQECLCHIAWRPSATDNGQPITDNAEGRVTDNAEAAVPAQL
jgi:hypothetical protein